jgi:hypothetical protein
MLFLTLMILKMGILYPSKLSSEVSNSMEETATSEADSHSADHEISYKSLSLDPLHSQMNPIHTLTSTRRKALTLAVRADVVGGTYGPCQKYKALALHNFSLCCLI